MLSVAADFVARLGSLGTVPGDLRTSWDLERYVAAMARTVTDDELLRKIGRAHV